MLKSAYYCYTDCYCYCCTRKKEFRHAQVTRPSMSADHRKTIPKTQVMRETRGPSAVHSAWASCSISIVRYVPPLLSLTTVHRVVSSRWAVLPRPVYTCSSPTLRRKWKSDAPTAFDGANARSSECRAFARFTFCIYILLFFRDAFRTM